MHSCSERGHFLLFFILFSCFFFVFVVDNQPPVISDCPENININVELGTASAVVTWVEPTATDNSGVVNLVTRSAAPGSSFNLGDTTVTYIFSDNSNNINTCVFTVTVTPGTYKSFYLGCAVCLCAVCFFFFIFNRVT